ncbi:DUF1127 domain-containing protein [Albidovulum sp.]|uniref:DUF1127 domain-containing protein n=1 Tax=Albidovulum sp. TaxID=1872424 RepID=UPI0025BA0A2B|nr:DUF1127 domain-containing protein [Defluviimonas sp.]
MSETFLFPAPTERRSTRLFALLGDWFEARQQRRAVARSIRGLSDLDDRLLRDIGLTRGDLEDITGIR